jgi:lysyl-tRNA synthetase class 2
MSITAPSPLSVKQPIYPIRFEKQHQLDEIRSMPIGARVSTAARVLLRRQMGQLTFATIGDAKGRVQISLDTQTVSPEEYERLVSSFGLGDIVGVKGELYHTKRGE